MALSPTARSKPLIVSMVNAVCIPDDYRKGILKIMHTLFLGLATIHEMRRSVRTVDYLVFRYPPVAFAANVQLRATITISRQHSFASL